MLYLRPCPPSNTSSWRSSVTGSFAWYPALLYFGFRSFHYSILLFSLYWNVLTINDPTVKVSMPFDKTYSLPRCPWTNNLGIWNQAPIRRNVSLWRANYHLFLLTTSNKIHKAVHNPPPVSTHILSNTTFPLPTRDQHVHFPLTKNIEIFQKDKNILFWVLFYFSWGLHELWYLSLDLEHAWHCGET